MDQFNFSYFPYTNFNEANLDWIMEHITACGNFWTASQSSLILDPDHGTGVSFYLNDMTGRPGVPEPQLGDAVFYSEEGITYVGFIDDVVGGGGSNPEFISFRRYRLTGPQGDPGTPGGTGLTEEIKQALLQLARKVAYIDADGEDYYQDLYDALYNVEPPASLVSIDAVYTQSGTVYDTDNLYSLEEDLVVTAYYSDGTSAVIPAQDYTLSGTLTVGTSTITVSYEGKTDTFTVTVSQHADPRTLLYNWDLTQSLTDTVSSVTMPVNSNAVQSSSGLTINAGGQAYVCPIGSSTSDIYEQEIEFDIGAMTKSFGNSHGRFFTLGGTPGNVSTTHSAGFIWRSTGSWQIYLGSWSGDTAVSTYTDIANKTITVKIHEAKMSVYDGDTLIAHSDTVINNAAYLGLYIGDTSTPAYTTVITGVRVYSV